MNRVAETEHDAIVEIPLVVRIGIVAVEPPIAVIIALDVEDVRIAVRIGSVCRTILATTLCF
jgi:hypothetical protein